MPNHVLGRVLSRAPNRVLGRVLSSRQLNLSKLRHLYLVLRAGFISIVSYGVFLSQREGFFFLAPSSLLVARVAKLRAPQRHPLSIDEPRQTGP